MQWITVFAGPIWQVQLYQGRLEEEGLQTFVPDESTKTVDPFATGGLPLMTQLNVPEDQAARAKEILESLKEATPQQPDDFDAEDDGDEDESEERQETSEEEVEWLATRTRWAGLMWVTFPFAVVTGAFYLRAVKVHGIRSTNHGLTIAALIFALINLAVLLGLFVVAWVWDRSPFDFLT